MRELGLDQNGCMELILPDPTRLYNGATPSNTSRADVTDGRAKLVLRIARFPRCSDAVELCTIVVPAKKSGTVRR